MKENVSTHNQESDVKDWQHELQQCQLDLAAAQAKLREAQDKYTYLLADWENFRRRIEKERGQWSVNAQAAIFTDIIGIVDDFERAFADLDKQSSDTNMHSRFQGFELIYKAFLKILAKYGVEEIQQMDTFDPALHEAVIEVPDSGKPAGTIIAVLQKGYTFKGQVIRPARVSVASDL
ncbi:MAG TPA: nucleotide exchange factor GrpE [Candidatus Babeliaceae bacterium]|nr:nucleotide exchange factor GrpE [Candidatus Babeliaceae bacterium]